MTPALPVEYANLITVIIYLLLESNLSRKDSN